MAVEDKYVDSTLAAGKSNNPAYSKGADVQCFRAIAEIAAADDDGSRYRIGSRLPANTIITRIDINNDAITGGSDYNIGLAESGIGGADIDDNVFADALDLSSANVNFSQPTDGMEALDVANSQKRLFEHAGHTEATKNSEYDLVLKGVTVGTAAGTVVATVWHMQG